jgi:hypothetical protein
MASNAREIHKFDVRGGRGVGRDGAAWEGRIGEDIDGGITHCAFEGVAGVGGAEGREAICEPAGWRGLLVWVVRLLLLERPDVLLSMIRTGTQMQGYDEGSSSK